MKAANREEVTSEELGGARVHSFQSGVTDYYAETEDDALVYARNIVENLNFKSDGRQAGQLIPIKPSVAPVYDSKELYGIVSKDTKIPFDIRENYCPNC